MMWSVTDREGSARLWHHACHRFATADLVIDWGIFGIARPLVTVAGHMQQLYSARRLQFGALQHMDLGHHA